MSETEASLLVCGCGFVVEGEHGASMAAWIEHGATCNGPGKIDFGLTTNRPEFRGPIPKGGKK